MSDSKKMELANVWIKVNDVGSQVQKKRISPAEAIVLRYQFGVRVEGQAKPMSPFDHLHITESVDRSENDDFQRLHGAYGKVLMDKVFPGENPKIPLTFKEAGFEQTDEKEPKPGKHFHQYIDLAKLPKAETTDEESVKELEVKKSQQSQIDTLVKQNQELQSVVGELLKRIPTPVAAAATAHVAVTPVASPTPIAPVK